MKIRRERGLGLGLHTESVKGWWRRRRRAFGHAVVVAIDRGSAWNFSFQLSQNSLLLFCENIVIVVETFRLFNHFNYEMMIYYFPLEKKNK